MGRMLHRSGDGAHEESRDSMTLAIDSGLFELGLAKLAPVVLDPEPTLECQKLFLMAQPNELLERIPYGLSLRRRVGKPHEVSKQAIFDVDCGSHTGSLLSPAIWQHTSSRRRGCHAPVRRAHSPGASSSRKRARPGWRPRP